MKLIFLLLILTAATCQAQQQYIRYRNTYPYGGYSVANNGPYWMYRQCAPINKGAADGARMAARMAEVQKKYEEILKRNVIRLK